MSAVGVFGILLGLLALLFSSPKRSEKNLIIFALCYGAHVASSVIYYRWSLTNINDTYAYYYDPNDFYHSGSQLNTYVVLVIVQATREYIGGT